VCVNTRNLPQLFKSNNDEINRRKRMETKKARKKRQKRRKNLRKKSKWIM